MAAPESARLNTGGSLTRGNSGNGPSLQIFSDNVIGAGPVVVNGTTVDNVGFDGNNGLPINMTFFDNAATAEGAVPDTGSTVGLLTLSLAALLGATRHW